MGGSHVLSGAFSSTFTFSNTTSVTFPTSGTLATTTQLPTPAALTKTDDTNVTLTLGGTPTTALLQATSLTLGWTGQLAVSRGGTGISSFGTGVATALGQNVNGSGAISLTTSPTFITPILGAASATSINFGGTSLSTYAEGTWTPIDSSGAGLSLTAAGTYTRIGRIALCQVVYPSTANGSNAIIGGLPFTAANSAQQVGGSVSYTSVATLSRVLVNFNATTFTLYSATGGAITNVTMTVSTNYFQLVYFV